MSIAHIVGVDPGLVHTGVVGMLFQPQLEELEVWHTVIDGPDAAAVAAAVPTGKPDIYVEAYRTRHNLNSDSRMMQAEVDLRRELNNARFLPNMGVKRVITADLLRLLEVWKFPTSTHHHDLRAAARIGLLGMVKRGETNVVLASMVRASIDGKPWRIVHV